MKISKKNIDKIIKDGYDLNTCIVWFYANSAKVIKNAYYDEKLSTKLPRPLHLADYDISLVSVNLEAGKYFIEIADKDGNNKNTYSITTFDDGSSDAGDAKTAEKLKNPINISLVGKVTGEATNVDFSSNVSITTDIDLSEYEKKADHDSDIENIENEYNSLVCEIDVIRHNVSNNTTNISNNTTSIISLASSISAKQDVLPVGTNKEYIDGTHNLQTFPTLIS